MIFSLIPPISSALPRNVISPVMATVLTVGVFVNADIMNLGNNIVFDFDSFPYPFKDNHFGYVYSRMVFEHLKNPYAVLEELWRIMRKGAFIDIIVPHYTSPGAHNPLHLCFYDSHVMDFVDKNMIRHAGLNDYGFTCDFELISTRLNFSKGKQFWNYAVELIANKKPDLYEGTPLSAFPCSSITFRMKARK